VGSSLAQPALKTAARESANINRICLEPMVATLDATDVAQAGRMVLIMDMLLNLSEFQGVGVKSGPQALRNDSAS
jgi:hypothetical protein